MLLALTQYNMGRSNLVSFLRRLWLLPAATTASVAALAANVAATAANAALPLGAWPMVGPCPTKAVSA